MILERTRFKNLKQIAVLKPSVAVVKILKNLFVFIQDNNFCGHDLPCTYQLILYDLCTHEGTIFACL